MESSPQRGKLENATIGKPARINSTPCSAIAGQINSIPGFIASRFPFVDFHFGSSVLPWAGHWATRDCTQRMVNSQIVHAKTGQVEADSLVQPEVEEFQNGRKRKAVKKWLRKLATGDENK